MDITVKAGKEEIRAARIGADITTRELDFAMGRFEDLRNQLAAAKEEMEHQPLSIGGVLASVGLAATAVVSVLGAAFTAGASLVALVPSVMALTATVTSVVEGLPAIAQTLINARAQIDESPRPTTTWGRRCSRSSATATRS